MLSHSAWPHRVSPSTSHILRTSLTHAQSEESGIEPGHIATITGSLNSFPDHDPDHYDTDHTDLASESDEAELRRVLLRDQWRQFFDKYDPEGFGEIPWSDLVTAMSDPEFRHRVGTGKREILLEKARTANTPAITFQDFVNVNSSPNEPPSTSTYFVNILAKKTARYYLRATFSSFFVAAYVSVCENLTKPLPRASTVRSWRQWRIFLFSASRTRFECDYYRLEYYLRTFVFFVVLLSRRRDPRQMVNNTNLLGRREMGDE
ncbi:hypothetical protein Zmor_022169 [Zophobas morio]|uniref:EF-hand domain-containing protein n=1 Tax=Zophobas morio TaxID=2755281 RepID=A0AA38M5P3_9CUCU|nr:hypothetical protein Zmor_022169 [Zophobas morio]